MSISRRTAVAVRTLGVASAGAALAVGFAGSAFACNPSDISPSVSCDAKSGQADIKIVDTDPLHTPITVTAYDGTTSVGSLDIPAWTGASTSADIMVPWKSAGSWKIYVQAPGKNDFYLPNPLTSPGGACTVPTTPAPSPTHTPTHTPTPTPSPTKTTTKPTPSTSTSPSSTVEAAASASPTGPELADTGGGSGTGLIAGIAGALVVVGGGAVFVLRRRGAAGRH